MSTPSFPSFSVVLIARNEEKTLPRLLESLSQFTAVGGQIIFVDTGSTDNTFVVAAKGGAKCFPVGDRFLTFINEATAKQINRRFVCHGEQPVVNPGDKLFDYSAARNYAASLARNDMVAMPDCDEAFTALDLNKIEEAIAGGMEQAEYNFVFSHDAFGGEAIKFLHSKFYNRRKLKWVGVVHEVLRGQAKRQFFPEDQIKLEHWQNPSTHRAQYLTGLALDCLDNPANDRNSHYLGREMLWTGRPWSAIQEFKRHIAMKAWPAERAQSMIFLGDAYLQVGKEEAALEWYHKAIDLDGGRREAWLRLADLYYRKNDPQLVACYAQAALAVGPSGYYANQMSHYAQDPHERLYWALWYLGNHELAKAHWHQALQYQPLNLKFIDEGQFFVGPHGDKRIGVLRYMIEQGINFSFVKLGDGEQECMEGKPGGNCDGHPYSQELGEKLRKAFEYLNGIMLRSGGRALVFDYHDQKNVNMLLHRKDNDLDALRCFYKAIRHAPRHKVFVGPKRLEQVAFFLQAKFLELPLVNAFGEYAGILEKLKAQLKDHAIFLFSAGMTSKCLIAELLAEGRPITCLDTGSAFDPIFVGETRTEQVDRATLEKLYSDMLPFPKVDIIIPCLGREEKLPVLMQAIAENASYANFRICTLKDEFPPNNIGVPRMVKKMVDGTIGDLVMYLGNDCLPQKDFLYPAVRKFLDTFGDGIGLVGLNDGYWHGEIATHWLASKSLLPLLDGEFFHTGYHHNGCDNELTERCRKLGKYVWCEESKVDHQHPILNRFDPEKMDDVNRLVFEPNRLEQDRVLLKERSQKLGFDYHEFYVRPGAGPYRIVCDDCGSIACVSNPTSAA